MIKKEKLIMTPDEIKRAYPLSDRATATKAKRDEELRDIFNGTDKRRKALVIGPCSAHDPVAVSDYLDKLGSVAEKVSDRLVVVPRIYTGKPRTNGTGYKGPMFSPDPNKEGDVTAGMLQARFMMIMANENGLPPADEMLNSELYEHMSDVLSYVAVGARSSEDQFHREVASGIHVPVGLKNPMSGDLATSFNSVYAAQSAHVFPYNGWQVCTDGNPLAHLVLRGYTKDGVNRPNYQYEDLLKVSEEYQKRGLKNPAVIVDTNHSNSGKKYAEQPRIVQEVVNSMNYNPDVAKLVKGFMVESFLVDGAQPTDGRVYGQSITDPCLGWDATKKLIYDLAEKI